MSIQEKFWLFHAPRERQRNLRGAIVAMLSHLGPRARFFLLFLPRYFTGHCSSYRAASHAFALTQAGHRRLGRWCWERAIRAAHDEEACHVTVDLCAQTGDNGMAAALANRYYDENGMLLAAGVRLTGALVYRGAFGAASNTFARLLEKCRGQLAGCWPGPQWSRPLCADTLHASLVMHSSAGQMPAEITREMYVNMARLCFSFGVFDVSATLFECSGDPGDVESRVARAYSLLRSDSKSCLPGNLENIVETQVLPDDVDWCVLLATVLFSMGRIDLVRSLVETAVRRRFARHADLENIVADCQHIVDCLQTCHETVQFHATSPEGCRVDGARGTRKIFICGNGWSGSGALYDALTEYDGFAEAPDTPVDRYVNPCTGNEMMLVQGASGLGMMWRTAKEDGTLSRLDLWELFRCHVLGGGAIGFTEHKGCKTALDLQARLGSRYTGIFRHLFATLATFPRFAALEQLRELLSDTTEAFTRLLSDGREDTWVVFNNAVFGFNVDMLEIFTNFRATVVVRDPLDQFVDRRNQDLKHWMKARRFVPVYRAARQSFRTRLMQLEPQHAANIREVEFERFVREEDYRQGIIEWLLEGRKTHRVRRHFDPQSSARNIRIHQNALTRRERLTLQKELKQWCRS